MSFRFGGLEIGIAAAMCAIAAAPAAADWWEHPHDKWYLKDDWRAGQVERYAPEFRLESPARGGWVVAYGDRGVEIRANGKPVLKHLDGALIHDADLTPFIRGEREVKLEFPGGPIVAEGEIVDEDGRLYPFASACDWKTPVEPGTRLPPAAKPYRPGDASGAFHRAHNGLLLFHDDRERGKSAISKALARIQKVRDQSVFLLRRFRPAEEVLSLHPDALWRRAERSASGPIAEAESMLKDRAIPAQKEGDHAAALASAGRAAVLISAAELAIGAALAVEEAEREEMQVRAAADLMRRAGSSAPTFDRDLEAVRGAIAAARREAALVDWGNVQKRAREARAALSSLSERLSALWGSPIGRLDEFPEDRFGWLNALPLMANDPSAFEFALADPALDWIDLRGAWSFRIDPPNEGEKLGWQKGLDPLEGWRRIDVPGPWERQGVHEQNDFSPWDAPYKIDDPRCDDKPYNGYAWYRREARIPACWSGKEVVLRVGQAADWLRVFVNGVPAGEAQRGGGSFPLPAEGLRPGEPNVLAIQVYNHNNLGGILGGPVALSAGDARPESVATPGPLSRVVETVLKTPGGEERSVDFASALSAAVVHATDRPEVRFWGWEGKGHSPPGALTYPAAGGVKRLDLAAAGGSAPPVATIEGSALGEGWLLISAAVLPSGRETLDRSRPVLLVLERRPRAVRWAPNRLGSPQLTLDYEGPAGRVLIVPLPREEDLDAADLGALARRLRAVPVACTEIARLDPLKLRGRFLLKYHYLEVPDFAGGAIERAAPVPQLLSYGLLNGFPGLEAPGIATTRFSSSVAPFREKAGDEYLEYSTPLVDRTKVLKGVGELFAKKRPELNARGGLTEEEMFDDFKAWGFDHCRYAFAWGADWDIPLAKGGLGGPVTDDPALWERMDQIVKAHTSRGIQAMLCYFFNEDSPRKEARGLVRNSTRYWKLHPEVRENVYELWRRIATRYAEVPEGLIAYDFLNEPAYMAQDDWNRIIQDLTAVVRSVDPKHLIVVEAGDGWSQPTWFSWVEPTGDRNTIYSFHLYGKHWGYDRDEYYPGYQSMPEKWIDSLSEVILFGIRHDVPIHCGEFGVSMISPGDDHLVWLDDYLALFERFGIGWNWWNWDGNGIYRTGLRAGKEVSPNLAVLRKWIDRKRSAAPVR